MHASRLQYHMMRNMLFMARTEFQMVSLFSHKKSVTVTTLT